MSRKSKKFKLPKTNHLTTHTSSILKGTVSVRPASINFSSPIQKNDSVSSPIKAAPQPTISTQPMSGQAMQEMQIQMLQASLEQQKEIAKTTRINGFRDQIKLVIDKVNNVLIDSPEARYNIGRSKTQRLVYKTIDQLQKMADQLRTEKDKMDPDELKQKKTILLNGSEELKSNFSQLHLNFWEKLAACISIIGIPFQLYYGSVIDGYENRINQLVSSIHNI